ncbi:flagellar biosynthetic protein FliO [Paenibacillus protaetiae]|uniref:Flagellar protein n=1 Tax=Paenibacillus protaetiae TaxID=2509456 RepID=A0A4P6ERS0_9BACL|nr:flagellar biosynthetic protein FliO [Paenibacillus protaetiae]QAY65612.1 flagellar protein [Paenibacillus protaetiae]
MKRLRKRLVNGNDSIFFTVGFFQTTGGSFAADFARYGDIDGAPDDLKAPSANLAGSVVWVIVALIIVIALIYIVIKFLAKRSQAWGTNRSLRSLGGITLGQNKSLQVVEIAGRLYVVGVGENVTLLDLIDDKEEVQALLSALELKPQTVWPTNVLANALQKLRRGKIEQNSADEWDSAGSFEQLLQDKWNRQSERKQQMESMLHNSKHNERSMDDEK